MQFALRLSTFFADNATYSNMITHTEPENIAYAEDPEEQVSFLAMRYVAQPCLLNSFTDV